MATKTRGRPARSRSAAVSWLAEQPWFSDWSLVPNYRRTRREWKRIADAVRDAGFYSFNTQTIDVPVETIVTQAMELRDRVHA